MPAQRLSFSVFWMVGLGAALAAASGCATPESLHAELVGAGGVGVTVPQGETDEPPPGTGGAVSAPIPTVTEPPPVPTEPVVDPQPEVEPPRLDDAGVIPPALPVSEDSGVNPTPEAGPVALPDSLDHCPGQILPLSLGAPVVATSAATFSLVDDGTPSCVAAAGGHDAVYRFVAPDAGLVRVALKPTGYTGAVSVRQDDCTTTELACAAGPVLGIEVVVTINVVAGKTYFVFADQAYGLTQGTFTLSLEYSK